MNINAGSTKWFDNVKNFKIQGHPCTEEDLFVMMEFCLALRGMGYGKQMKDLICDFESTIDIYKLMYVIAINHGNDTKVRV